MTHSPRRRFERKYPLTAGELLDFRWWHRAHGRAFRQTYAPRTINNIYFDSPAWDRYAGNTSGVSSRTKCRLRWYGEAESAEDFTFEAKHRRNATGHKETQTIPAGDLGLPSLRLGRLYERLRPLLRGDLRILLDQGHRPVLYNRYHREYYATGDGVRMTVDTRIVYSAIPGDSLRELRLVPSAAPTVVEIKHDSERREEAEAALRRLPFRATRSSKYVIGIDHLWT